MNQNKFGKVALSFLLGWFGELKEELFLFFGFLEEFFLLSDNLFAGPDLFEQLGIFQFCKFIFGWNLIIGRDWIFEFALLVLDIICDAKYFFSKRFTELVLLEKVFVLFFEPNVLLFEFSVFLFEFSFLFFEFLDIFFKLVELLDFWEVCFCRGWGKSPIFFEPMEQIFFDLNVAVLDETLSRSFYVNDLWGKVDWNTVLLLYQSHTLKAFSPCKLLVDQWLVAVRVDIQNAYIFHSTKGQERKFFLVKSRHWENKIIQIRWLWALDQKDCLPFMDDIIVGRIACGKQLVFCKLNKIVWCFILVNDWVSG